MDVEQGELVLCDNLPFDDFVGIPVSSRINNLHRDEFLLEPEDIDEGILPKLSKVMVRKTLVISKAVITKKYGKLTPERFQKLHSDFCKYFDCFANS